MSIHSINHVQLGFPAGQQARVRHFYSELLGLKEFRAGGGNALRFFAGSQRVDLVPVSDWHGSPAPSHLAFEVQNLPGFRATLDLAVMDVGQALESWDGAADAWFLDGFSPALNPGMWSDAVLEGVAARSAPGASLATFTVAGAAPPPSWSTTVDHRIDGLRQVRLVGAGGGPTLEATLAPG